MPQFELREASVKSCSSHPAGRERNLLWTTKLHTVRSYQQVFIKPFDVQGEVLGVSGLDLPHSTVPNNLGTDKVVLSAENRSLACTAAVTDERITIPRELHKLKKNQHQNPLNPKIEYKCLM